MTIDISKRMALSAILFFLYGCSAGIDSSILKDDIINHPSKGYYIHDVPFIPQKELYCGPASLATVLNFYGVKTTQEEIGKEIYLPKLRGTLNIDLLTLAKQKGAQARYYSGSLDDIKINITKNRPLILLLNLGYEFYPVYHYMVVIGFHEENGFIIAHSGIERDKAFSYKELLNAWGKTSFGTLLITPSAER